MSSLRKSKKKRLELYLINDDATSFDDVIHALTSYLPECSKIRAGQIALITHNKGVCHIYTGPASTGLLIQTMLLTQGLKIITKLL